MIKSCPACYSNKIKCFYRQDNVPAQSSLLMSTKAEAINCRRGDLDLALCCECGFIFNRKFVSETQISDGECEVSQGFSSCFNSFAKSLADKLISEYGVKGKTVIEIGCGKGEFLELICERGRNNGIGIDPAFKEGRIKENERLKFYREFYSPRHGGLQADLICCRHTLEHISDCGDFMRLVRENVNGNDETALFFEIPDVERILDEGAFWDIYYEHCSYFTMDSFSRLFRKEGFEHYELYRAYQGQYIISISRPVDVFEYDGIEKGPGEERVDEFVYSVERKVDCWRRLIKKSFGNGEKIVLWGAGSKGVAFLTTLDIVEEITFCVDINPFKAGMFMPGTGQEILRPEDMEKYQPDKVIIMNPVYYDEIKVDLEKFGVRPEILAVC